VVHLFGEKVSKILFCLLCWGLWLSRRFFFVFAFFHLASEIMKVVIIFLLNIGMVKLQSVYCGRGMQCTWTVTLGVRRIERVSKQCHVMSMATNFDWHL